MTIRIAIAALAASFVMGEPAFADTSAYMSTGADTFGKIDLNSGVYANIGDTCYLGTPILLSGLGAYGGGIYGGGEGLLGLYKVNPGTGALTLIGNSSEAYEDTGSTTSGLYEFGKDSNLYTVNPSTGATTLIGPMGIPIGGVIGMSSSGAQLFIAELDNLYSVNTTTGAGTLVGLTPGVYFGAMVEIGGTYYGGSDFGPPPYQLLTFDPMTAATTAGAFASGMPSDFWGLTPDRRSRTFDLGDDAGRFCRSRLGGPSRGEIAFRPLERLTLEEAHFRQVAVRRPALSSVPLIAADEQRQTPELP
jgi:hypothetical protein